MGITIKFIVKEEYDGARLREFLRRTCSVSASILTQLKRRERGIEINGVHARVVEKIKAGDVVSITLPDEKNEIPPVCLPIKILYEDEHVIAYDKPPFMAAHPVHGHQGDTLANAAAFYALSKGESYAFHAINRLDRDTSGVLLAAKNGYSAPLLAKTAKKVYIGVCEGLVSGSGTINAPIRLKEGHTIERETGEGGVPAVTHYRALKFGNGHTLLSFTLETGRTHQIRVHMASIGHPLAGDDMYGGSRELIDRQALHCAEMTFVHPITGECVTIGSPLPSGFEGLIQ